MKIVFIADAHLKGLKDPNQDRVVRFLEGLEGADVLVMLGDMFEFLTGSNRVARRQYGPSLIALERLSKRGVRIICLEGNHDFSLGPLFAGTLKAAVYPDLADIELDGRRFLLGHGDIVSMSRGYSVWRGFLRSLLFRLLAAVLTDGAVWAVANYLSRRSRGYGRAHSAIDERLKRFAGERLKGGFDAVVFGHSHAPGIHRLGSGKKEGIYANPGSFIDDGRHLVYEDGRWEEGRGADGGGAAGGGAAGGMG